ncbi:Beta-lactamase superfamily domain [Flavonifractor plautii]|nr:Beta-lactamase superfamily domain [Flavonifractor plautii]
MNIPYEIISTGSKGNAVVLNQFILIDCGVPFKALRDYYRDLKLVLLTHIHSDHFNRTTIRRLAYERPTLRFGCCRWLVEPLVAAGVGKGNIDVLEPDVMYGYGLCNVIPVLLVHNVPNCGYKVHFPTGKVFYATDTNNLNGIRARGYDLYLIEANYEDDAIREKIRQKKENQEYAYEYQVLHNHLSKAKCDDFIYANIGPGGQYVYLHCHQDVEEAGPEQ